MVKALFNWNNMLLVLVGRRHKDASKIEKDWGLHSRVIPEDLSVN